MASETEHVQLAGFDTAAKTDKQNERLVSAFESTYRHATFFFARLAVLAPFFCFVLRWRAIVWNLLPPTWAAKILETEILARHRRHAPFCSQRGGPKIVVSSLDSRFVFRTFFCQLGRENFGNRNFSEA